MCGREKRIPQQRIAPGQLSNNLAVIWDVMAASAATCPNVPGTLDNGVNDHGVR